MDASNRVAVYARFSCDKQRDASIEDQVAACRKHCDQRGYEVVGVYPDYAISGRSDDRPQFLKMIDDASAGAFDIILVWKMDRFARNMQDQYFYEKVLAGYGVRLESAMENIAGNSIEATVSKGMFAMFAQIRSQQTSVDTMRGMLGKAEKCQYLGDRLYGYGHKGDVITVNPAEAEVVARAHNDYLNDVPPDEIISWMRWEGVKTTRGNDPNYNWLRNMLRNERYAGVYMWGKKKDALGNFELDEYGEKVPLVRVEGGMPAIVTKETKSACLKKLGYVKRYNTKYRYLLSGKLRCSECGELMHGETCRSRNGSIYRHYNCKKKRRACTGSYIVEQVDYAVAKHVRQVLLDRELCKRIAEKFIEYREKNATDSAVVEGYKGELRDVERQQANLTQAVADGMPYASVRGKLDALAKREAALRDKIDSCNESKSTLTKENVLRFLAALADNLRTDEEILETFINSVWIYGEKAVAIMNFDADETSKYEIDLKMKNEPPDERAVRSELQWLPKIETIVETPEREEPIYETRDVLICNACGYKTTSGNEMGSHLSAHAVKGIDEGYCSMPEQYQTGSRTIPAVTREVDNGHYEQVESGGHWE